MSRLLVAAVLVVAAFAAAVHGLSYADVRGTPYTVSYDHRAITVNGQRELLLSGSVHYPRSTPEMWPDLLRRSRDAHLNVIQIYTFWNLHEPVRGQYDFTTGNKNVTRFLDAAADAGLWVVLRIGPYVCAEWDYGGLPVWLRDDPDMVFRDFDSAWMDAMQRFMQTVVDLVEPYLARHGGPIILAQTENEYGNVESWYGRNGSAYVAWNAQLAASMGVGVPWIMCQQSDAPDTVVNTCNGFYCDNFLAGHFAAHPDQPGMWTENWPGWFQHWGEPVPHRPVEDVAFAVARWVARGGTHHNYYMWHGGTTFGRWTGGPFIVTSYDYDVALNEYGLPAEPKYGHSAELHRLLMAYGATIVGAPVPTAQPLGPFQEAHVYGDASAPGALVFLSNIDAVNAATVTFGGQQFALPAWSVTLVAGGTLQVLYVTSKVAHVAPDRLQPRRGPAPDALRVTADAAAVSYVRDVIGGGSNGVPPVVTPRPAELLSVTKGATDYLWYVTNVVVPDPAPATVQLTLANASDYVYVYVAGALVGAQTGNPLVPIAFSVPTAGLVGGASVPLQLLVLAQGLVNYGPFLERLTVGLGGDVVWNGAAVSGGQWTQTPGLVGEYDQYYTAAGAAGVSWTAGVAPAGASLVWYNVNLTTPNPLPPGSVWALDLAAMGKGAVYLNGNHLGRYWSVLATAMACDAVCDYRGPYTDSKCRTGCGEPSQRYYHAPREWMAPAGQPNRVVLLEETADADPTQIAFVQMNP